MSSLTAAEKLHLENVLNMDTGYVLNFTNATFGQLFNKFGVGIHGTRYQIYGTSKAKKMRAFWEIESDVLVGRVLAEMLDTYVAQCESDGGELDSTSLRKSRKVVARLTGIPPEAESMTSEGFMGKEFQIPNLQKLPVDFAVATIIQDRLKEAQRCLQFGAHLSVIFLCGSVLEGVLLGAAQKEPEKFNRSGISPKKAGKVKAFQYWTLAEFINVGYDIGLLKLDVLKFGHGLRDFRNYIHPYQQLVSRFEPDKHTANVCFQVLKAALADVAGER